MSRLARMARRIIRTQGVPVTVGIVQAGTRNQYGEWVPGGSVEHHIRAVTTPLPFDRDIESSGSRIDTGRVFWFDTALAPIRADAGGDKVIYEGNTYTALAVEGWAGHWKVTAIRGEQAQ